MKIAKYEQISTKIVTETIKVDDVVDGEVTGFHEELVTREVPVVTLIHRDMTPEEEAEALKAQAEAEAAETNREPTTEERIEAQVMYTALMTDTLLIEEA